MRNLINLLLILAIAIVILIIIINHSSVGWVLLGTVMFFSVSSAIIAAIAST